MNHLNKLMKLTIDAMIANNWKWPDTWAKSDRLKFIEEAIEFLEQREMYEQCQVLIDVKETIEV
jgi:hypothetical protein